MVVIFLALMVLPGCWCLTEWRGREFTLQSCDLVARNPSPGEFAHDGGAARAAVFTPWLQGCHS